MSSEPVPSTDEPASIVRHAEDVRLARAVVAGDAQARGLFAQRMECVPRYLAAANKRVGGPLTVEDLADLSQDTLIVIWQKLETYAGRATLESWAWRFCQLELANRVRRRRFRRGVTGLRLDDVGEGPAEASEPSSPMDYEHLERGLEALGPAEEEVIRLKHFEHLKFSEIAERLGISPNTAKTRYYRGMVRLREILERQEREPEP